jgi:ankyrin repeat protein
MKNRTRIRKKVWIALLFFAGGVLLLGFVFREDLRTFRQRAFVDAAFRGSITTMRALLLAGANVDAPACESFLCPPPIVAAAFNDRPDAVGLLLDRGANVNGRMQRGQTALMIAAYQGHTDTVKLLLSKGADFNVESQGDTALGGAKQKGRNDIVEILVKAGAIR